ncbi:hypothetical protein [Leptolyngbya sp. CCNP1308]|uniref:hypothetical protein n=1 Tax=Leptolyngbya sp. CCNP1308 TaxID=3110255 RepID=UPI002B1EF42C|nr:hypothetical protein [Leptolyngbya sp. CCNP1308]
MLCTSCQNKPHCLAAQLAEGDAALAQLLGQLRRCSLKSSRRSLGQRVKDFWTSHTVWNALRLRPKR